MGNSPPKSALLGASTPASAFSTTNISPWLDEALATRASGAVAPWRAEEIQLCLKDTPFDAILSAIERAVPAVNGATEIGLYDQWIKANDGTSPFLYMAWFNIGVLFALTSPGTYHVVARRIVRRLEVLGEEQIASVPSTFVIVAKKN